MSDTDTAADHEQLLQRAVNLFEFLGRCQQLRASPARTTATYQRDGSVLWFADLPSHPAVQTVRSGAPSGDAEPLLFVDRVPHVDPPQPSELLSACLDGEIDDLDEPPELHDRVAIHWLPEAVRSRWADQGWIDVRSELPEALAEFEAWSGDWQEWADQERRDAEVRDLYTQLFAAHLRTTNHPEELEMVLGVGLLAWGPPDPHPEVGRHVLTMPCEVAFDDATGRLSVQRTESEDPLCVELDMLDPGLVANPVAVNEVKRTVTDYSGHPLDLEGTGRLAQRLVHILDAQGEFRTNYSHPSAGRHAIVGFTPALIVRKRSQQGLVEVFQAILHQLQEAAEVPAGLLPLVDPDQRPLVDLDPAPGAIVDVDDEPFLPLPVNARQLDVIKRVDSAAQSLVQGPPGTGKTHTAAALLSHLLAQGKRVLVTAHTDRALYEVRDKLPASIRPLAVSVVGASRSDMADLKMAVERISSTASDYDANEARRDDKRLLDEIDVLSRDRAVLQRRLVDARRTEVEDREHAGSTGTLAAIALKYLALTERHAWINELADVPAGQDPPLSDLEIGEFRQLLLDDELSADEAEALLRVMALDKVPPPLDFAALCDAEQLAREGLDAFAPLNGDRTLEGVRALDHERRSELRQRMRDIAAEASDLERRRESWMNDALDDVRAGKAGAWQDRARAVHQLIDRIEPSVAAFGPLNRVVAPSDGRGSLVALARTMHAFLASGGKVKTTASGEPRIGAFSAREVKDSRPLFDSVRVDRLPPVTKEAVETFLLFDELETWLTALDQAWPADLLIPPEDTFGERLQWHKSEHAVLTRVLSLGMRLLQEEAWLQAQGLPKPDWSDLESVHRFAHLVDVAAAHDALAAALGPLDALTRTLEAENRWEDAVPCVDSMLAAVRARDFRQYENSYQRLTRLHGVRAAVDRREALVARLSQAAPRLAVEMATSALAAEWDTRLATFEAAWRWASTGAWIVAQPTEDINGLQAQVQHVEARIRSRTELLAATRAWSHAVKPSRLTGQRQADLAHYAQLVRSLGKGTGKYAARKRADIRRAMERCSPAVPVWIMPLYRIAEQLRIQPNMFDVVIVDEASQAGASAAFLQYLAPKIVIIGDDRQVSPSAVGVDQQQIADLANQYLADDRYKASWQDPKRSLFDEAVMRFGSRITLTEHRRCMPEIIGFSNRIAYEPDGVRLTPVRQFGADRLEPVMAVHVDDGYEIGISNKVNPAERDAIVDQIEKCISDPAYDGKTFGVISLLGQHQARAIENLLMERIPPEEWSARDLRCGDAADFQGSERDVVFLSMVKSADPEKRIGALTSEMYVQRYNVAASRAKDQMWLFHSVTLADLGNPEDMRFALLDYVYGVIGRSRDRETGQSSTWVPEDVLVDPFESLFEQRIYNRLLDRGFSVVPQFEASGYRIDLVVVGASRRLAIECDGDRWHGPDAFEKDLARQRDLERCGWTFFRIRESAFYVEPERVLGELWDTLVDLHIRPSDWVDEEHEDLAESTADESPSVRSDSHPEPVTAPDDSDHLPHKLVQPSLGPEPEPEPAPEPAHPWTPPAVGADESSTPAERIPFSATPALSHLPFRSADETPQFAALTAYEVSSHATRPVSEASRAEILEGVLEIVRSEGPVLGTRLHTAYVRASGGARVGKNISSLLNSVISQAVRRGDLVASSPLNEVGVKLKTYRLPGQPEVRTRELGPRSFDEIPPTELAALIADTALSTGWSDQAQLQRAALSRLNLVRLTTSVRARLDAVLGLAIEEDAE